MPAALFGARLAARNAPSGAGTIGSVPHTGSIAQVAACKRALAQRYGLGRELFERAMDLLRVDMCFLEITPERW
jgi:hypothetical protein